MQGSRAYTEFHELISALASRRDYEGYVIDRAAEFEMGNRCEVAVSYTEFRVRIDNGKQFEGVDGNYYFDYDEHWVKHFGEVLRMLGMTEMVKPEWETLSINEFDAKAILSELDRIEKEKQKSPKEKYAEYLQTEHWKATRRAALERAEYRCQICNNGFRLEVHHRTYVRLGKERPTDLTVLCNRCHELYEKHRRLPTIQ